MDSQKEAEIRRRLRVVNLKDLADSRLKAAPPKQEAAKDSNSSPNLVKVPAKNPSDILQTVLRIFAIHCFVYFFYTIYKYYYNITEESKFFGF